MAKNPCVDWLKMEDKIRAALKSYRNFKLNAEQALKAVDDAIGEETGRGWELEDQQVEVNLKQRR